MFSFSEYSLFFKPKGSPTLFSLGKMSQAEVKEPFPIPVSLGTETGMNITELGACSE